MYDDILIIRSLDLEHRLSEYKKNTSSPYEFAPK